MCTVNKDQIYKNSCNLDKRFWNKHVAKRKKTLEAWDFNYGKNLEQLEAKSKRLSMRKCVAIKKCQKTKMICEVTHCILSPNP